AEVLSRVNDVLVKDRASTRFVTMVYAILDAHAKTVSFANAGHVPPLFVHLGQASVLDVEASTPLGLPDGRFSERTVEIPLGSELLFYSDGLSETVNAASVEYGIARMLEHFATPSSTMASLLQDIRRFAANQPCSDDVTVVMVGGRE